MGLMDFITGAADEGARIVGNRIKAAQASDARVDLEQRMTPIMQDREQAAAELKQRMALDTDNKLRQQQTERISSARQGIVDTSIASRYADSDAAVADADAGNTVGPLTDEQRAAIAQSKDADRLSLDNDPKTYIQAGMRTGDITPKDVLASTGKSDRNATWQDVQMAKILSSERNTDVRAGATTAAAEIRKDAAGAGKRGGLTEPQRVKNFEIDAARKIVDALSPEEIKRKTAKFTNTGRENPEYDANLATRLRWAEQRKYGDDPVFDAQLGDDGDAPAKPAASSGGDVASRFSADPAMKGMKTGAMKAEGLEVLDASGKLIGHYR